ncbi:MAG: pyridoxamine 5'-phosphate oxidase family protein [Methylobacterium sp.]|uniref:pyridoxamine 5'-phosphate oxidase family protein n=1 Tax=Methylobacterium sp. TaxID=409 RepID=UPI0025FC9005|nr:pyridoxamine 5'-phosphate oxidase family protein [Methylobacterium sp.]MBX9934905.1 pyridoxamine 5'-phosphate oxidase family protein [Methylobacterium sp.]
MIPLPPFHDDLDASLNELWRLLEAGAASARTAFHTPSLATIDGQGRPQVRTVVLRSADRGSGTLRFHCDRRSHKADDIARSGFAALHAYDAQDKVQIRVSGSATLHADDAVADAAWAVSMAMSRVCYGTAPAPGTVIATGGAYTLPDEGATGGGRANFCAVVVAVETLEFLYLDRRGHRRAGWARSGEGWSGDWLVP